MSYELLVYTAYQLTPPEQQQLTQSLREMYQIEGCLFLVDPSIIGGMKLVFRDRIEDYSVRSKLAAVKKLLTSEQADEQA